MTSPSDHYFSHVKTEEDYKKMLKSGMAWEVEPAFPSSWAAHLKLVEERNES